MKTKEQIEKQSSLIQAAKLIGASYESFGEENHKIKTPCGITLNVYGIQYPNEFWSVVPQWPEGYRSQFGHCQIKQELKPIQIARRIQNFIVSIAYDWDSKNQDDV
jgi:hypothetical protein